MGIVVVTASACSFVNAIDVCDRPLAEETVANLRFDGEQRVESLQASSRTPDGNALLLAYRSEHVDGSGSTITTSFVTPTGEPFASCGDEGRIAIGTGLGHASVALAPDPNPEIDLVGLLVYTRIVSSAPSPSFDVMGVALRRGGCAYEPLFGCESEGTRVVDNPFVIATEAGVPISAPQIVSFDADGYVVVWTRSRGGSFDADSALRARRVRYDVCLDFPGHARDATGEPADLTIEGNQPTRASVASLGDGRFFVLWYEERGDGFDVVAAGFDETLREVVPAFVVTSRDTRTPELLLGPVDPSFRTALAWDGAQLLATWVARDATGGPSHVFGRFFDAEGRPLRAPDAPDGEAFRVGTATSGSESAPTVSPMPSGGFFVAWTEQEEPGRSDSSGAGLRAALFEPDGSRSFSNQACGAGELGLNRITANAQTAPAAVQLADGTTAVVWNDLSQTLPDRDGSAVRVLFLPERDLLPVE